MTAAGKYFFAKPENGAANDSYLHRLFGDKNAQEFRADEFNSLSDANMPAIADLHKLKLVNLYGTSITSKSLQYLANLPLESLILSNTGVSD